MLRTTRHQLQDKLKATSLHGLHMSKRAKMAPYAGWSMPIQYEGMAQEHIHTRAQCSLFDVSHMGQIKIYGADRVKFMEWVTCADLKALNYHQGRLAVMMNEEAGVLDDLILTKNPRNISAVLNAARMKNDVGHLVEMLCEFRGDAYLEIDASKSLMALQGPSSAEVLSRFVPNIENLMTMSSTSLQIKGIDVHVGRSGYTGEDGFELSVAHKDTEELATILLGEPEVKQAGLGARNSLRVEAGFCLYGHELDEKISIAEARLMWLVTKRRREEGGFIGHEALMKITKDKYLRPMRRVGITSTGLCPREGAKIQVDGKDVGYVTSGCPSPTLKCNVAQGYVHLDHADAGSKLELIAREGRPPVKGEIVKMPMHTRTSPTKNVKAVK